MKQIVLLITVFLIVACGGSDTTTSQNTGTSTTAQASEQVDEQYKQGKKLFNANCNVCHELKRKVIGPPLAGIGKKRSKEWLYAYIRDNNALRKSGDKDAIAVYEEYNGAVMNTFRNLTDEQIDAIIYYCDTPKK